MNINFVLETLLLLLAILASNGIIYSFTKFKFNRPNSSENLSVLRKNSGRDGLALTSLMASNPIRLTSSESSTSQTLSMTSSGSGSNVSQTFSETSLTSSTSVISSDTNLSQDIFDNENLNSFEINEGMLTHTENSLLSNTNEGTIPSNVDIFDNTTSLDSVTILNSQSFEE